MPGGGKGLSVVINVMDIMNRLWILEHISAYKFYVYAFPEEPVYAYPILWNLKLSSATWNNEYRKLFIPYYLSPFNINMVFLNIIIGIRPRKLYIIHDVINKVNKHHQESKQIPDTILGVFKITWKMTYLFDLCYLFQVRWKFYHPYTWGVTKKTTTKILIYVT